MKIALFPSAFHPSLGGVEELTRQLAHAHQEAGHEVIVITECWPRDLPAVDEYEGIPLYRFPMRVPAQCWKSKATFALTHRMIRGRVAEVVRKFGADVLHAQCVSSTTLYALHVRKALGLPLVATLQGELNMDAAGIFQRPGIARKIMHRALGEAESITACSRDTLREAEEYHGQSLGGRSEVIYNGIRLADFEAATAYAHGRPYILALGRFVKEKGFDLLVRSFAAAGEIGHDLLVAGDGDERGSLERLTQELGVQERVHWLGRAPRAQVVQLFKGCSFFVLPSRHEPLGIVNLEAMAAGKAIIASRVGGVPEIVKHQETGLLVTAESVSELTRALKRLAGNPTERAKLGLAGAAQAAAFDWRILAKDYRAVYARAMAGETAVAAG